MPSDKTYIYKREKGRLPLSTSKKYHYIYDEIFHQIFGWHVRSNGTFTTSQYYTAGGYGKSMLFFPIGDYRYVFAEEVYDLYSKNNYIINTIIEKLKKTITKEEDISQYISENPNIWDETLYIVIENFIKKHYQDSDLMLGLDKGVEIVFDCNEYYLFPYAMKDIILDLIYPL